MENTQSNLIVQQVHSYLSEFNESKNKHSNNIKNLFQSIEIPTLYVKIHSALAFRRPGHFDKAMLEISEANRDQITAIRKVQTLLGELRREKYPTVIFEKFRQFEPFEIGLADAEPVLSILNQIQNEGKTDFKNACFKLHELELLKLDEEAYIEFLERHDGAGDNATKNKEAMANLAALNDNLVEKRVEILKSIFNVVSDMLKEAPRAVEINPAFLELSQNLYLIVTSSILTKNASNVTTDL